MPVADHPTTLRHALGAGMRALAGATDGATLLKQRTLALWVAQNRLAAEQLATPWPAPGEQAGSSVQAGATFAWRETVSGTPNPAFRRIEIVVVEPSVPQYALATLVGYVARSDAP